MNQKKNILTSVAAGVLTIQFNRPEKKNAVSPAMYASLYEALQRTESDKSIRAILIRGDHGCFCAGNDIADLAGGMQVTSKAAGNFMHQLMVCELPVVAAVSGPAIGIGMTLLLQCDLIYADQSAFFTAPFTRLGVCPEAGSSFSLAQRVGYAKAAEMLLLSKRVAADEALAMGLINDIVPAAKLYEHSFEVARQLAGFSPVSVQTTKSLLHHFESDQSRLAFDREIEGFRVLLESPEAKAAFEMFLASKQDNKQVQ